MTTNTISIDWGEFSFFAEPDSDIKVTHHTSDPLETYRLINDEAARRGVFFQPVLVRAALTDSKYKPLCYSPVTLVMPPAGIPFDRDTASSAHALSVDSVPAYRIRSVLKQPIRIEGPRHGARWLYIEATPCFHPITPDGNFGLSSSDEKINASLIEQMTDAFDKVAVLIGYHHDPFNESSDCPMGSEPLPDIDKTGSLLKNIIKIPALSQITESARLADSNKSANFEGKILQSETQQQSMNTFMKNLKAAVLLSAACTAMPNLSAYNPQAPENAVVNAGNARFTVLTPELIRIEYSDSGVFEDRATFTVVNRELETVPPYTTTEDADFLYINTDKLALKYRKGSNLKTEPASAQNLSITLTLDGSPVEWYPGKPDPLNLKGTTRTLDGSNGDNKRAEMENGVISRSGWAVVDDSWSNIRPDGSRSFALEPNPETGFDWWAPRNDEDALDLYFFGYGKNYKKAVSDYTKIAGKIPLPPDYVLGYWYSKYSSYSADDFRQIVKDLKDNNIPADVLILDMDWHWNGNEDSYSKGIGGWTGWSWNTNLIPDAKGLLKDIHDNNLKTALNLHPADGVDSIESPRYFREMSRELGGKYQNGRNIAYALDYPDFKQAFFNNIIREHEAEGVDFWWIDWQQHLTSKFTPALGETFWNNHVFFNDMAHNRPDHRPLIFHRWGGLGSHRYQIGFSGDALVNYPTLAFQPYFTATASNVGYAYWGHDLGGHVIAEEEMINDPELLLRWIQFGVFTPVFRTHATKDPRIERRVWTFENFPTILEAIRLRYTLFPYLYTMARKTYDTGIGMVRPLYYEYPDNEEAYTYENEYFFGDDILVAPVVTPSADGKATEIKFWLPEGNWWSVSTNEMLKGDRELTMSFALNQIPYFYRQGALIPLNPPTVMSMTERPAEMILDVVSGADGVATLYEDQGDNSDYDTVFATTELRHVFTPKEETVIISPRTGSDAGLAKARAWTINLLGCEKPGSVYLNGKKLKKDAWSYNPATQSLSINTPLTDCSQQIRIAVRK